MAQLNARTDSFITLLLDVSGRARPGDLTAMGSDEAAATLQSYADAHPERGLIFDGESLVPAPAEVSAPAAVPAGQSASATSGESLGATAAPGQPPAAPGWEAYGDAGATDASSEPGWNQAAIVPGAVTESPYEAPSPLEPSYASSVPEHEGFAQPSAPPAQDMFAQPTAVPEHEMFGQPVSVPEHEMFPGAPAAVDSGAILKAQDPHRPAHVMAEAGSVAGDADYGVPMSPGVGGYYGVADQPPPEYSDAAKAGEYQGDEVFDSQPAAQYSEVPSQPVVGASNPMPWWWWVVAIVFYPLGGIIGYFVVRRTDPRGARSLLILTLVIFVLGILAAVAAFFLGFAALSALMPAGTAP